MTWRAVGLAAVGGVLVVFTCWYVNSPRTEPINETPWIDRLIHNYSPEKVAAERRIMEELLEATQKTVDSFNQEANRRDRISEDYSTVDNLLFGEFVPVVAAAAKYHANMAQEHPEKILLSENLVDRDQRAASRASLTRMRNYLAMYQLSLPPELTHPTFICGNDRAAVADALSRKFYRSQIDLESERFDEIAALLDLMDGVGEAALDEDTIVFPTQRQEEDYQRSLSRIKRLAALSSTRNRLLEQRREKRADAQRIKSPPGIWDFLNAGNYLSLDRDQIRLNGKSFVLPVEKALLVSALGKPREIEGDTTPSVWDYWGIMAFHKPRSTQIDSLIFALRPRPTPSWPTDKIRGRLRLLGVLVDENSTPWSLNRKFPGEKFRSDESGNQWTLALQSYTITTQFDWDGTIDSLIIHALPPRQ